MTPQLRIVFRLLGALCMSAPAYSVVNTGRRFSLGTLDYSPLLMAMQESDGIRIRSVLSEDHIDNLPRAIRVQLLRTGIVAGNMQAISWLLEHSKTHEYINEYIIDSLRPLDYAVATKNTPLALLLIGHGAKIPLKTPTSKHYPLVSAVVRWADHTLVMNFMARHRLFRAIRQLPEERTELINALITRADTQYLDLVLQQIRPCPPQELFAALKQAMGLEHHHIITRLLAEKSGDWNPALHQNPHGTTLLMLAAARGCSRCIENIMRHDARARDLTDHRGSSALDYAYNHNHPELFKLLGTPVQAMLYELRYEIARQCCAPRQRSASFSQ